MRAVLASSRQAPRFGALWSNFVSGSVRVAGAVCWLVMRRLRQPQNFGPQSVDVVVLGCRADEPDKRGTLDGRLPISGQAQYFGSRCCSVVIFFGGCPRKAAASAAPHLHVVPSQGRPRQLRNAQTNPLATQSQGTVGEKGKNIDRKIRKTDRRIDRQNDS